MRTVIKALLCISALAPFTANANLLQNGGFEDSTGLFPHTTIVANNAATFGAWFDRQNFRSVDGDTALPAAPPGWTGDNFARQTPAFNNQANTTDMLFQAFSGALAPAGSVLNLSFDYYRVLGTAQVVIYGIAAGGSWDPDAPFNDCVSCTLQFTATLAQSASWTTYTNSFTVLGDYAAIAVAFIFGGNLTTQPTYANGIDQVRLTVPEPATLALFGAGLLGVGLARRRRMNA